MNKTFIKVQKIKHELYNACVAYVSQRVDTANSAVVDAQASANSEEKSTAGDKHDTARAMMQLAAEQNAKHLAAAKKLNHAMTLIDPESSNAKVGLGSLVIASNGNFYIAISVGKIELNGTLYFAISPSSPMGQILSGLKKGDVSQFNGMKIEIKEVH
ncbi:MAG: transcription elongation GreA/GreB family factor [Crocinitomix sp.]|jgi:transcription elongation GreA/GreB family factor